MEPHEVTHADHWAPDHLVLARRRLSLVGPLSVAPAVVVAAGPRVPAELRGPADLRRPADDESWLDGPFGRVWSVAPVPAAPGVFALVESGSVRYVGHTTDLARTFSRHGLGEVSGREHDEDGRLNHLVLVTSFAGRTVDLYVLVTGPVTRRPGGVLRGLLRRRERPGGPDVEHGPTRADGRQPELAHEMAAAARGTWQLG